MHRPIPLLMYPIQPLGSPLANLSNSNTPMGPFHTTVLHSLSASSNSLMLSGPMSRPWGWSRSGAGAGAAVSVQTSNSLPCCAAYKHVHDNHTT